MTAPLGAHPLLPFFLPRLLFLLTPLKLLLPTKLSKLSCPPYPNSKAELNGCHSRGETLVISSYDGFCSIHVGPYPPVPPVAPLPHQEAS